MVFHNQLYHKFQGIEAPLLANVESVYLRYTYIHGNKYITFKQDLKASILSEVIVYAIFFWPKLL